MNDSELDKKLKAARGPALEWDYVDDFPRSVLAKLRSSPSPRPSGMRAGVRGLGLFGCWMLDVGCWMFRRPSRLAWGLAATICLFIAFTAGHWHGRMAADQDVLANARLIQETLAMFPNRLRAIVQDEHGLNLVLSDQANVPVSTPIYVRICNGQHCSSVVTFSGQEVQMAGQKITVLSDGRGGVIVEGNQFAWSNSGGGELAPGLKVQARFIQIKAI
jgi:hypothetical protein